MKRTRIIVLVCVAVLGLVALAGSLAVADPSKDATAGAATELKLPPGWTLEDMKACMMAGTPGKQHEHLVESAGEWRGQTTMWHGPGSEPMHSECTSTEKPMMDGRFLKAEIEGEMPGMGPYNGLGLYGFDNVSKKFVSTWVDNQSTGMMYGEGELSDDGKTMTWNYKYNCPINKKPTPLRLVETATGPKTKTLEMFGAEPKSGEEFKMMRIEFTKK
jgi:hypothetical protein